LTFCFFDSYNFKAIGGVRRQKNMSSLFCRTHCCGLNAFYRMSKFTWFRRYDLFNFRGPDFYIGNRGVIFVDSFTIFAYKIVNIDVESTKIVTKMQTMNKITKKILRMKIFENFGQNWANSKGKFWNSVTKRL